MLKVVMVMLVAVVMLVAGSAELIVVKPMAQEKVFFVEQWMSVIQATFALELSHQVVEDSQLMLEQHYNIIDLL